MPHRIFLFGEAEKGELCTPLQFQNLIQLYQLLGNPPKESLGIDYAVQTLLHKRELFFYRIREEGFSFEDYEKGASLLDKKGGKMHLSAICLPGLGCRFLINDFGQICKKIQSILILSEKDLYDYLTASKY